MTIRLGLLFTFFLQFSCNSRHQDTVTAETLSVKIETLGQEEKAIWDYYQEVEKQFIRETEATEDQTIEFVQSLIDKGLIYQPTIFIETKKGTEAKTVDYKTYKEFRKDNPIDLKRHYIVSFFPRDSLHNLYIDSVRTNILNALKSDSITRTPLE